MTKDESNCLMEALMYLEMIGDDMPQKESADLAWAAHYLIQKACMGHEPPNWQEVVGRVRETAAYGEVIGIWMESKAAVRKNPDDFV